MLALLAVLGLLLLTTSTKDLRITANLYWGKQAFYAADAGINMAMDNVEDFIFGATDTLATAASVTVDPGNSSDTATYTYQATKRTSGSLRPRAGYEVGAWAGAGFDLAATGQTGMAQSQIEVLSRATVPIDAYTGGK
jgi:Tfp pilus assembly protein PilX